MRTTLRYGSATLDAKLPDGTTVVAPQYATPLPDPAAAVRAALAGAAPLASLDGDDDVAIVFSPRLPARISAVVAAELLAAVEGRGVSRSRISLIIGRDLEFASSDSDPIRMLGHGYRVLVHDPHDPDGLLFQQRYPGERRAGIYLSQAFQSASARIVVGEAAPHFAAGWTQALAVLPGVAAAHNVARTFSVANLLHPDARSGVSEGNPIFDATVELATTVDVRLALWLASDFDGQVTHVFAGGLDESIQDSIETLCPFHTPAIDGAFDIVVAGSVASTLAATAPALTSASALIKAGGAIVLAAPCRDGLGDEDFRLTLAEAPTIDGVWNRLIAPDFQRNGQWFALHLFAARRRAGTVHLQSELPNDELHAAHLAPTKSIGTTLGELAMSHQFLHGEAPSLAVLPDGASIIPPPTGTSGPN